MRTIAFQEAAKPAVIIDLDPQASAATWAHIREAEYPAVASAHAPRLADALATASNHGYV